MQHSRRQFLKSVGLGTASVGLYAGTHALGRSLSAPPEDPNVIFILADDLGYGDLGCYGATKVRTPQIDELAQTGIRFTDAHSPSAVCSPSRYGVLTGRYCWRTSLKKWVCRPNDPLLIDTRRTTLASLFKAAGYRTACIGKWHLGFGKQRPEWDYGKLKPGPLEIGFDYYFGVPTSNNWPPFVYVENHGLWGHQEYDVNVPNHRIDEQIAATLTRRAVEFIETSQGKPFFLYFPTCNIHSPIRPNNRFREQSKAGLRGDFVEELDWSVGEILDTLERLDLAEETLVVFTSDNGGQPGPDTFGHNCNGSLRGRKGQIYEGGHRIPFIARWPGKIRPNTPSDELICLTDFFATCASILGANLPSEAGEDSVDILPALMGEQLGQPLREAIVHHSADGTFAIRKGDWKLILGLSHGGWPIDKPAVQLEPGEPAGQLFNLREDPQETQNVYLDYPQVVRGLEKLLQQYVQRGNSRRS